MRAPAVRARQLQRRPEAQLRRPPHRLDRAGGRRRPSGPGAAPAVLLRAARQSGPAASPVRRGGARPRRAPRGLRGLRPGGDTEAGRLVVPAAAEGCRPLVGAAQAAGEAEGGGRAHDAELERAAPASVAAPALWRRPHLRRVARPGERPWPCAPLGPGHIRAHLDREDAEGLRARQEAGSGRAPQGLRDAGPRHSLDGTRGVLRADRRLGLRGAEAGPHRCGRATRYNRVGGHRGVRIARAAR
mmetsp:Transcript_14964/g.41391  ORF Transcript_14964/g.41391 Transcript_14964/m.41391 type:complete len:244 (-) Transcript_14964:300-1031(-)